MRTETQAKRQYDKINAMSKSDALKYAEKLKNCKIAKFNYGQYGKDMSRHDKSGNLFFRQMMYLGDMKTIVIYYRNSKTNKKK